MLIVRWFVSKNATAVQLANANSCLLFFLLAHVLCLPNFFYDAVFLSLLFFFILFYYLYDTWYDDKLMCLSRFLGKVEHVFVLF